MIRLSFASSRLFIRTLAMVLVYSFVLALGAPLHTAGKGNTAPSAQPQPSPTSTPAPSPMPSASPAASPAPTQSTPTQSLPNLDSLRNIQPEEPEIPEAVPSNQCSPGQPDCNPDAARQISFSHASRSRRLMPKRESSLPPSEQLLARSNNASPDMRGVADASQPLLEPQPQSGGGTYDDFAMARLDPDNRIGTGGEDVLSRNFNWSLPLIGMPGRSGLNLGLSLSYNSLVWTRAGNHITYDADKGFPTPGFRLGFPTIYGQHYNSQTGKNGYLVLMPSGARVELRQVSSTNTYEAADSSYLFLVDNGSTLLLRSTDGTQLSYALTDNGYRCTQVKDRNGNYLTVTNSQQGRILSITDTLGRVFNFNYDTNNNLVSITQTREGTTPYTWATFGYGDVELQTNFTGLTEVGLRDGASLPVLTQVGLPDGTYYKFSYNSYGQVYKITYYAADSDPDYDNHALNYVSYNLPQDAIAGQTDCPRFTQRKVWAENWNESAEVVTNYTVPSIVTQLPNGAQGSWTFCQMQTPDGVYYNSYYPSSGWNEGLPVWQETWADEGQGLYSRRLITTSYTQDNTTASYRLNPRVQEIKVLDGPNTRRTTINYSSFTLSCGTNCTLSYYLPSETKEYAANATDVLRTTQTDYNLSFDYTSRRIFGLVSEQRLYDTQDNNKLLSKVAYEYDNTGEHLVQQASPVQHDSTNFGTNFSARGNLTKILRYDVTNTSQSAESKIGYNTAGSVIFQRNPKRDSSQTTPAAEVNIKYDDSFSDNQSRNTYAYPTQVWLSDTVSTTPSTVISHHTKYDYHLGKVTSRKGPPAAWQSSGAEQTFTYDTIGRLERVTNAVNNAYTRFVYPSSSNVVQQFTTINDLVNETVSTRILDGAGRVHRTASDHPNLTNRYTAQQITYDEMGRVWKTYNPREIFGDWTPAGDDASGNWMYVQQTYDWKGRPRITTHQDGTSSREVSYEGCGCAGGEVVTLRDEVNRKQRITHDVLGRVVKVQEYNWGGSTVYRTTTNTYNALDQVTSVLVLAGESGTGQLTSMTYDGYGRLKTRHLPQQDANLSTNYEYYDDGALKQVKDARQAWTKYIYNDRNLVTKVQYGSPTGSNIPVPEDINYTYDSVGNRMTMTYGPNGADGVTYSYNQLSRLTKEVRTMSELGQSYTLDYDYNLAGQLTSISDPNDTTRKVTYSYNRTGSLSSVGAHGYAGFSGSYYASDMQYRAWGALKHMSYGSGKAADYQYNARLQPSRYEVSGVMGANFQYFNDGRPKFVDDIPTDLSTPNRLDRSYEYDHVGRLIGAYSGNEATTPGTLTYDGPYRQTFGYNAWDNLTARDSAVWGTGIDPVEAQYTNNRRDGWTYDADGRPLTEDSLQHKYDAAGRKYESKDTQQRKNFVANLTITQGFDGDGLSVKQQENNTKTFLIRSTALGGQPVWEIAKYGTGPWYKKTGFIYANGQLIATQKLNSSNVAFIQWLHTNPVTKSQRSTNADGTPSLLASELDPLGLDAGVNPPPVGEVPGGTGGEASDIVFPRFGDIMNGSTGCTLDRMIVSCDTVMSALEMDLVDVDNMAGSFKFGPFKQPASANSPHVFARSIPNVFDEKVNVIGIINPAIVQTSYGLIVGSELLEYRKQKPWLQEHVEVRGIIDDTIQDKSAMDIAREKNCATPNSIVEYFKNKLEDHWSRTTETGEENGSLLFYEAATNSYPDVKLSEGRHLRFGTTQYAPVLPAMPEIGPETRAAFQNFSAQGRTVYFLAFFHTHPGSSQTGKPSGGDIQYQIDMNNVLGIIRTRNGYSFFSNGKTFGPGDAQANECIWLLNSSRN